MNAHIEIDGQRWRADLADGIELAVAIAPGGRHPRFFTRTAADFRALAAGSFSGSVAAGGSCNAGVVTLIPHCHGTHTEGPGHITAAAEPVHGENDAALVPASLVSVEPVPAEAAGETPAGDGDVIESGMLDWHPQARALVIRTLPNDAGKQTRDYAAAPPYPLLSIEAMAHIAASESLQHLLIDTPSVDAADDGGRLAQHRRFWQMAEDDAVPRRPERTITEMIFVPEHAADGFYLLHRGLSAIRGEATPSTPTIFACHEC